MLLKASLVSWYLGSSVRRSNMTGRFERAPILQLPDCVALGTISLSFLFWGLESDNSYLLSGVDSSRGTANSKPRVIPQLV